MAEYEDLRLRHLAALATLMPDHPRRLGWPAERLRQERRDRLRDLLGVAFPLRRESHTDLRGVLLGFRLVLGL